jgi:hypothetical protein
VTGCSTLVMLGRLVELKTESSHPVTATSLGTAAGFRRRDSTRHSITSASNCVSARRVTHRRPRQTRRPFCKSLYLFLVYTYRSFMSWPKHLLTY